MTQPMPAIQEDPSVIRGLELQDAFAELVPQIRGNLQASALAIAENLEALTTTTNSELAAAYNDLQQRRRARLATLEAVVPTGPDIAPGTSPADAALLHQAFRAALNEARSTDSDGRAAMLTDATVFDDDVLRRAVLTASIECSDIGVVRSYTDLLGITDQLDELIDLRDQMAGGNIAALVVAQALRPMPILDEVRSLPMIRANAAVSR